MRTTNKKQAIRNAFYRLGMHTTAKGVVHDLPQQGIQVDEEFVAQVKFELLQETTRVTVAKVSTLTSSPTVRRSPKGFLSRGHT